MIDSMIKDGIWDVFNGYHMGVTAENVAEKWQITRDQQDEFALNSQLKAEEAQKNGKFQKEIVSVPSQSFLYFFAACSAACFSSLSSILFLRFSFRFVCLTFSFSLLYFYQCSDGPFPFSSSRAALASASAVWFYSR